MKASDRAEINDQLVNGGGDAIKDVINELPIPDTYKHILTNAIDNGQMMHNGAHIRNTSDLADFSIQDCGDYIKNMVRDMDIDPSVKSQIMDCIDIAQEQNSQVHAFSQAAVESQEQVLSHYSSDDGVIDISQERMYNEPDYDAELRSADQIDYQQQDDIDFNQPDDSDFLGF